MIEVAPYVDGYYGAVGFETTKVPRVKFPFSHNLDTYSRLYERDFEVAPKAIPIVDARIAWTNLLTYSEDFTNAAWTKANLTVTADVITAADGVSTMDKLLESSATGEHSVSQAATVTNTAHEVSFFIKGGLTRAWVRAAFTDSAATVFSAFFSTNGYVLSPAANTTAKIYGLGNGYFYCVLRFTPAAGAGTMKVNLSTDGATISYAGTTSAGVYLWGAQVAAGSGAPYISTDIATRSVLAPHRDTRDPMAYLIKESDPTPRDSSRSTVTRTFGRIPRQQIVPGSRFITKPDLPGDFPQVMGDSLVIQPEENVPRWIFYTHVPVTSDSGVPQGNHPTGGTWTITINGQTTAGIAYNASASTVQAAVNALSLVAAQGGVTVTGQYTAGFTLVFNARTPPTVNTAGLTSTGTGLAGNSGTISPTAVSVNIVTFPTGGLSDITAGTFTLTMFGQTTAPIAYNATITDVVAAVSALSNASGLTITGSRSTGQYSYVGSTIQTLTERSLVFSLTIEFPTPTVTGSSLTPAGSTALITQTHPPFKQYWSISLRGLLVPVRTLFAASHGITAADGIVLTQGDNYRTVAPGNYSVPTPDTIALTSASGLAYSTSGVITAVGKQSGNVYTGGTKLTRVKRVTDYYLIGVSPGITTLDDIPLPVYEGDDASLLEAIFAGDTDINYEVGELEFYLDGPIVQRTRTTLDASQL